MKEIPGTVMFSHAHHRGYALSVASSLPVAVVPERTYGFVHGDKS